MSVKRDHAGHVIELLDGTMKFGITGPEFTDDHPGRSYDSFAEAVKAIDTRVKAAARAHIVKLDLKVMDAKGREETITGIHAGTGRVMGVKDDGYTVYPAVDWVKDHLKRIEHLTKIINKLRSDLAHMEIRTQRCGARPDVEQLEQALIKLQKEYAEATERGMRMAARVVREGGPPKLAEPATAGDTED